MALMLAIDAKFWGVVVMGGAVVILFFSCHGWTAAQRARFATVRVGASGCMPSLWSGSLCWLISACNHLRPMGERIRRLVPCSILASSC